MSVNAKANLPSSIASGASNDPIHAASPDIIIFNDDSVSPEAMADLTFEVMGGQELINIVRHDTVNGINIIYQPIKNLPKIASVYGPQSIVPINQTSVDIFKNFAIKFENHVVEPGAGSGPAPDFDPIYIDSSGDLVIDVVNIFRDEQVEIQILNGGELSDDTIY